MKYINKFRIGEKNLYISIVLLLILLFITWFFESYFAEVMFFMDYSAADLSDNAKDIMLRGILTWERYIDSSMRYIVNFFPIFAILPTIPFLQERKSYYVLGVNRFDNYYKNIINSILTYSIKGGLCISISFSIFFLIGNLFLTTSITNIGGFSSIFPSDFYVQNPCLFFLFMTWTAYFTIGIAYSLMSCGISLLFDKEIYMLIIPLIIYIAQSFVGNLTNFIPLKISESVCAFNTLYSTGEIFIPIITLFIFDVILILIGLKKRREFIDA